MRGTTLERGSSSRHGNAAEVDPRFEARRQEVERDHGRRRRSRVISFAIVAVAITVVVGLVQSPLLDIDRFDVASTEHVSADQIIATSGVELHQPLALVDAEAVRAKLLQLPWVADASVVARWPGTLRLVVTERTPVAIAAVPDGFVLVDHAGRVLGAASSPPAPDLTGPTLIEGLVVPGPGNLVDARGQTTLEVLAAVPNGVRSRLEAVVIDQDGEVALRLRPGMVAIVGTTDDLDQKMRTLQTTLAQVDLADVDEIDVRIAGRADITRRTPSPAGSTGTVPGATSTSAGSTTTPSGSGGTSAAATGASNGTSAGSASPTDSG